MFRLVLCVLTVHEVAATCCVGATAGLNCCVHPAGCCRADYRHECCDGDAVGGGFVAENIGRNNVGGGVVGGGSGVAQVVSQQGYAAQRPAAVNAGPVAASAENCLQGENCPKDYKYSEQKKDVFMTAELPQQVTLRMPPKQNMQANLDLSDVPIRVEVPEMVVDVPAVGSELTIQATVPDVTLLIKTVPNIKTTQAATCPTCGVQPQRPAEVAVVVHYHCDEDNGVLSACQLREYQGNQLLVQKTVTVDAVEGLYVNLPTRGRCLVRQGSAVQCQM